MKQGFVYILTNKPQGVLYIGVTNDIARRFYEHQQGLVGGFSKKYQLKQLVHVEIFDRMDEAIAREKQLKNWHREWKMNLIEASNPEWKDISNSLV